MLNRFNHGVVMRALLILTVMSFATVTFANEMDKGRFETRKAKTIEMAEKRITSLQALKSCVNSSSNREGLKKCQETHREKMKGEMKARKEMRMKRKEKKSE